MNQTPSKPDVANDRMELQDVLTPAVAFHDELASSWNDKYEKSIFQQRAERFRNKFAGLNIDGQTWLDAGCGTGTLSRMLSDMRANVIGFDASPQMIDAAKQASDSSGSLQYKTIGNIESLPLADDSVDGIVCSSVIEYLNDPAAAISEFSRVLRPGGRIILTVPNKRSLLVSIQRTLFWATSRYCKKPFPSYMVHSRNRYSAAQLDRLMSQYGFCTELIEFTSFWPSSIELNVLGNMCLYSGTRAA